MIPDERRRADRDRRDAPRLRAASPGMNNQAGEQGQANPEADRKIEEVRHGRKLTPKQLSPFAPRK